MNTMIICELCKRENVPRVTEHHLIPREEGGKDGEVAWICDSCHKQIHALYTNKELALRLYTLDRLSEDEQMSRYLRYIKKQPASKQVRVKKSRAVRKRK